MLLRERLIQDGIPLGEEHIEHQFKAHLFRDIGLLSGRIKSLEDLADLVAFASKDISSHDDEYLHEKKLADKRSHERREQE